MAAPHLLIGCRRDVRWLRDCAGHVWALHSSGTAPQGDGCPPGRGPL